MKFFLLCVIPLVSLSLISCDMDSAKTAPEEAQEAGVEEKSAGNDTVIVLFGTLKPDSIERYIALHDSIPQQIITNLQATGVTDLDIYKNENTLILTIEKDAGAPRNPSKVDKEAEDKWQATTGACFDKKWVLAENIFDMEDHIK